MHTYIQTKPRPMIISADYVCMCVFTYNTHTHTHTHMHNVHVLIIMGCAVQWSRGLTFARAQTMSSYMTSCLLARVQTMSSYLASCLLARVQTIAFHTFNSTHSHIHTYIYTNIHTTFNKLIFRNTLTTNQGITSYKKDSDTDMYTLQTHTTYCGLQNNWDWPNGFQRIFVPVYSREIVENRCLIPNYFAISSTANPRIIDVRYQLPTVSQ
jgi:hypothetical protein